jgi:phosphate uptake regulator
MNIIFTKEIADQLRERYTVLELEVREYEGKEIMAYCVVTADQIPLSDLPMLQSHCTMHEDFLRAYHAGHKDLARDISKNLYGKFGGELDTFYDEILRRINES